MKTKHIIYPVTILILVLIPIIRYYVSTPWINACVLDYVDNMENSNYSWYIYKIDWVRHIEARNSNLVSSLKKYEIWKSNWCLMVSDNLFSDINNTFYCTVTYMIKKSKIDDKYKKPLWILKSE
jgi:hypothetical protein